MMRFGIVRLVAVFAAAFVTVSMISVDFADARRGGSFGSRGTRTFQSAPPTRTAPNQAAPVERSMTPAPAPGAATRAPQTTAQRPGMFSGFGGSLMRGLLIGGLFGMLLGYGFGGMAGVLGFLVQALVLGLLAALIIGYFRSRRTPALATAGAYPAAGDGGRFARDADERPGMERPPAQAGGFRIPSIGGGMAGGAAASAGKPVAQDIDVDQADLDTFERRLGEVQQAFSDEDHAALRRLSTPEMVSFFSEELAENAKKGVRNEVRDVHLVQADIAEAWREDDADYATAAFRYESVDSLRDRQTGAFVGGDETPTDVVELWTFVRQRGQDWKLSAIQEA
jgi:predicted lipid-binding transport protein (Tim44 family)